MLQCIGQQQDRTRSGRRHGGVEEAGTRAFGWTARHVRWPRLVGVQMDQRFAFHPQMAVVFRGGIGVGHGGSSDRSLKTAPMRLSLQ